MKYLCGITTYKLLMCLFSLYCECVLFVMIWLACTVLLQRGRESGDVVHSRRRERRSRGQRQQQQVGATAGRGAAAGGGTAPAGGAAPGRVAGAGGGCASSGGGAAAGDMLDKRNEREARKKGE